MPRSTTSVDQEAPVARRRVAEATPDTITISLRAVWGEQKSLVVPVDSTVEELLAQQGLSATTEVRLISGRTVTNLSNDSILEDGDILQVISQKKVTNGLN